MVYRNKDMSTKNVMAPNFRRRYPSDWWPQRPIVDVAQVGVQQESCQPMLWGGSQTPCSTRRTSGLENLFAELSRIIRMNQPLGRESFESLNIPTITKFEPDSKRIVGRGVEVEINECAKGFNRMRTNRF